MHRPAALLLAAMALLAACAGDPEISRPFPMEAAEARRMLVEAAARGAVRLDLVGLPASLSSPDARRLAAEGISGASVVFATDAAAASPRLILAFDTLVADPAGLCAGSGRVVPASPHRLAAVLCDGGRPVVSVAGTAAGPRAGDTERLVWRTTGQLFPDDYPETYGLNLFGSRLRVGVGGSFGF
ncbi:MAG TPA: hypothetical protein PKA13_01830 [Geminicoccaceae bacterium]|nr:hypothetical protein [Geminicoccus sp.]HMU48482.1 hypothetical protein [Geminicoccaceae bacterium]